MASQPPKKAVELGVVILLLQLDGDRVAVLFDEVTLRVTPYGKGADTYAHAFAGEGVEVNLDALAEVRVEQLDEQGAGFLFDLHLSPFQVDVSRSRTCPR